MGRGLIAQTYSICAWKVPMAELSAFDGVLSNIVVCPFGTQR
jgi:hypothetical protein